MNRNERLARKHNAKVMAFRDLPAEARYSLIFYMAVGGEAWDISPELEQAWSKGLKKYRKDNPKYWDKIDSIAKRVLKTSKGMQFYLDKYGDEKFGYANIPTSALKEAYMKAEWGADSFGCNWKDFKDYSNWYKENQDCPKHSPKNKWPCILSTHSEELLEDGWHRFHRYIELGCRKIPCLFYA